MFTRRNFQLTADTTTLLSVVLIHTHGIHYRRATEEEGVTTARMQNTVHNKLSLADFFFLISLSPTTIKVWVHPHFHCLALFVLPELRIILNCILSSVNQRRLHSPTAFKSC